MRLDFGRRLFRWFMSLHFYQMKQLNLHLKVDHSIVHVALSPSLLQVQKPLDSWASPEFVNPAEWSIWALSQTILSGPHHAYSKIIAPPHPEGGKIFVLSFFLDHMLLIKMNPGFRIALLIPPNFYLLGTTKSFYLDCPREPRIEWLLYFPIMFVVCCSMLIKKDSKCKETYIYLVKTGLQA